MQLYREGSYIQTPYIVFVNEIMVRASNPKELIAGVVEAARQIVYAVRDMPNSVTDKLALGNTLLVLQHALAVQRILFRCSGSSSTGRSSLRFPSSAT
jgi:hypothetical protein